MQEIKFKKRVEQEISNGKKFSYELKIAIDDIVQLQFAAKIIKKFDSIESIEPMSEKIEQKDIMNMIKENENEIGIGISIYISYKNFLNEDVKKEVRSSYFDLIDFGVLESNPVDMAHINIEDIFVKSVPLISEYFGYFNILEPVKITVYVEDEFLSELTTKDMRIE